MHNDHAKHCDQKCYSCSHRFPFLFSVIDFAGVTILKITQSRKFIVNIIQKIIIVNWKYVAKLIFMMYIAEIKNGKGLIQMEYGRHRTVTQDQLPPLPLNLKAVGCYCAEAIGWEEYNDGIYRNHSGLFWCKNGSAKMNIARNEYDFSSGEVLYYYPFEAHKIKVTEAPFQYFWITFDGEHAENILKMFQYPRHPFFAGDPPEELYRQAYESLGRSDLAARRRESSIVYQILTLAGSPQETQSVFSHIVGRFKQIVDEESGDPELDLNRIANRLHCHRTTLTRVVRKEIGITPSQYLNQIRFQHALDLLSGSDMTAAEIAVVCGFSTPEYFSRKFKQLTGEPPRRFRNH